MGAVRGWVRLSAAPAAGVLLAVLAVPPALATQPPASEKSDRFTYDPSLVRRARRVVGRRWTWPGVPSTCTDDSWSWPDVAG